MEDLLFFIVVLSFLRGIVYWVQTAGHKNKMKNLRDNNTDSLVFNPL